MRAPAVRATAIAIFVAVWMAIAAAAIYLASAAGYSLWIGAATAFVLFSFVNLSIAYRFRVRQLRQQGKEPPPFLVYLFHPAATSFREPVLLPRPFRVLLGIVVLIGAAFVVFASAAILLTQDVSTFPHPVAGVAGLIVLASVGALGLYVSFRLIVMRNNERMLKGRTHQ